jgi:hypothetical protein
VLLKNLPHSPALDDKSHPLSRAMRNGIEINTVVWLTPQELGAHGGRRKLWAIELLESTTATRITRLVVHGQEQRLVDGKIVYPVRLPGHKGCELTICTVGPWRGGFLELDGDRA